MLTHLAIAYEHFNWLVALGLLCTYVIADGLYAYYTHPPRRSRGGCVFCVQEGF